MTATVATVYALLLHLCGLAAVVVLLALGKIDPTVGESLLSALLGIGVGAGVMALTPTSAAPTTAAAPVLAPPATAAVVPHLAGGDR